MLTIGEEDMGALPRQRNQRGQGARLREELIEVASDLLAERGDPDRLSIRAVAAAAGVTPASIYLHFVDRTSLLRAVVAERFRASAPCSTPRCPI